MRIILALLLLTITAAAYSSTNKKYGELGPRISQAEFEANQSESLAILIPLLKEFEGFSPKATRDRDGTFTICWGHTGKSINAYSTCTLHQGEIQLQMDASKALAEASEYSPILKNKSFQTQAALGAFIFNIGIGNYQKSAVRRHIDRNECSEAKADLQRWIHARHKALRGLAIRRRVEAGLLDCAEFTS